MREINFPEKDKPLRDDVSVLGSLVGEMLAEQQGSKFLQQVEAVRLTAIGRREGKIDTAAELDALLGGMDTADAGHLVRAFTTYFQVVNLQKRSIAYVGARITFEEVKKPSLAGCLR